MSDNLNNFEPEFGKATFEVKVCSLYKKCIFHTIYTFQYILARLHNTDNVCQVSFGSFTTITWCLQTTENPFNFFKGERGNFLLFLTLAGGSIPAWLYPNTTCLFKLLPNFI